MLEECSDFKTYLIKYWANQFYNQAINRTQYPNNKSEEKVINYILELAEKVDGSTKTVEIVVKRNDIAEYIGCSKRTVYRVLNRLEEGGYLTKKGHRLVINPSQRNRIIKKIKQLNER